MHLLQRREAEVLLIMSEMVVRMTGHEGEDDRHMDNGEVCRDGRV